MPTYQIDREITSATGTQTYKVEARDIAEAAEKFESSEGELVSEELDADSLSDICESSIYKI